MNGRQFLVVVFFWGGGRGGGILEGQIVIYLLTPQKMGKTKSVFKDHKLHLGVFEVPP